jgi:hypothetical protein
LDLIVINWGVFNKVCCFRFFFASLSLVPWVENGISPRIILSASGEVGVTFLLLLFSQMPTWYLVFDSEPHKYQIL